MSTHTPINQTSATQSHSQSAHKPSPQYPCHIIHHTLAQTTPTHNHHIPTLSDAHSVLSLTFSCSFFFFLSFFLISSSFYLSFLYIYYYALQYITLPYYILPYITQTQYQLTTALLLWHLTFGAAKSCSYHQHQRHNHSTYTTCRQNLLHMVHHNRDIWKK